jgi:hypothetical protein
MAQEELLCANCNEAYREEQENDKKPICSKCGCADFAISVQPEYVEHSQAHDLSIADVLVSYTKNHE